MSFTAEQIVAIETILQEAFDESAFMSPDILDTQKWVQVESPRYGIMFVPLDDWEGFDDAKNPMNDADVFGQDVIFTKGTYTTEVIEGFGARMSAAGYMDCSDWTVHSDPVAAARYLAETYGNG